MKRVLYLFAVLLLLLVGPVMDAQAFQNEPLLPPGGLDDPDGGDGGHPWGGENSSSSLPTKDRSGTSLVVTGYVVIDLVFNYFIFGQDDGQAGAVTVDRESAVIESPRVPFKGNYYHGDAIVRRER